MKQSIQNKLSQLKQLYFHRYRRLQHLFVVKVNRKKIIYDQQQQQQQHICFWSHVEPKKAPEFQNQLLRIWGPGSNFWAAWSPSELNKSPDLI